MSDMPSRKRQRACNDLYKVVCLPGFLTKNGLNDTMCPLCESSFRSSLYNANTEELHRSYTCASIGDPPLKNFQKFSQIGFGDTLNNIFGEMIDNNQMCSVVLGLMRMFLVVDDTGTSTSTGIAYNNDVYYLTEMIVDYSKSVYVTLIQLLRKYLLSVNLFSIELISDRVNSLSCADFLELYNSLAKYPSLQEMLLAKHNLSITLLHLCLDDRFVGKGEGCSKVYEMQKALREKQLINTLPLEEQPIQ